MVYNNELDDEYESYRDKVLDTNMHPDNKIELKNDKFKLLKKGT